MKKRYVIKNLPAKLPIHTTILYAFLLYYFNAAQWIWGAFITLTILYWIIVIINFCYQKSIDISSLLKNLKKEE